MDDSGVGERAEGLPYRTLHIFHQTLTMHQASPKETLTPGTKPLRDDGRIAPTPASHDNPASITDRLTALTNLDDQWCQQKLD